MSNLFYIINYLPSKPNLTDNQHIRYQNMKTSWKCCGVKSLSLVPVKHVKYFLDNFWRHIKKINGNHMHCGIMCLRKEKRSNVDYIYRKIKIRNVEVIKLLPWDVKDSKAEQQRSSVLCMNTGWIHWDGTERCAVRQSCNKAPVPTVHVHENVSVVEEEECVCVCVCARVWGLFVTPVQLCPTKSKWSSRAEPEPASHCLCLSLDIHIPSLPLSQFQFCMPAHTEQRREWTDKRGDTGTSRRAPSLLYIPSLFLLWTTFL